MGTAQRFGSNGLISVHDPTCGSLPASKDGIFLSKAHYGNLAAPTWTRTGTVQCESYAVLVTEIAKAALSRMWTIIIIIIIIRLC